MARGAQVESLWSGLFDDSGQALAGGKVYAYAAGTSTPKALYTDSGLTPGNETTHPLVLDGEGRSLAFASGAYKFVVKTSADVTLYTLDNLYFYEVASFGTWTPTYSGGGTLAWTPTPTTTLATYKLVDDLCFFAVHFSGTIASGTGGQYNATLPFTSAATGGNFWASGIITAVAVNYICAAQILSSSNQLSFYKSDIGATTWSTGSGGGQVSGFYKIA